MTGPTHLAALLLAALLVQEPIQVWLCPVHRDEQATRAGECSVCQRTLVRRQLISVWACPMHAEVVQDHGGECPLCSMSLVRMTRELEFYCPDHDGVIQSEAGRCPHGGNPLSRRAVPMPHGDHNPRHDGILFMAPDGFHHLEGALSEEGLFRLYVYDNFTRPLDARSFEARIADRRLAPAADGAFLELRLEDRPQFPAEVTLLLRLGNGEEERFDFIFPGRSAPAPLPTLGDLVIPERVEDIVTAIYERHERLRALMARGAWTELFIPALEAKDLALALGVRVGDEVALPVKKLVRAAWLLDMYGDLGNREKVASAYGLFEAGIRELERFHAP